MSVAAGGATRAQPSAPERPAPTWKGVTPEVLTDVLKDTVMVRDIRERAAAVRGLAKLRDPALSPLFAQLAASGPAMVRVEAILGLAELEPARGLDLLLLRQLGDAEAVLWVVLTAWDRDLLAPGQLDDLARWLDLQPRLSAVVAGLLTRQGNPPGAQRLRDLTENASAAVAVHAGLVLGQQGDGRALAMADGRMAELLTATALNDLRALLTDIARERLSVAADLCLRVRLAAAENPLLRFEALRTLLLVAPADERVASAVGEEVMGVMKRDLGDRLRLAFAFLEAALANPGKLAPQPIERLAGDPDPLVSGMARAAMAINQARPGVLQPVMELIGRRHGPSLEWALRLARSRPWQDAYTIRAAVLEAGAGSDSTDAREAAVAAATDIADDNPEAMESILDAALRAPEAMKVQCILAGALRSKKAGCAALASRGVCAGTAPSKPGAKPSGTPGAEGAGGGGGAVVPLWPNEAACALAQLLAAKSVAAEGADAAAQFERLGRLALGSGGLPGWYRVQAAWLALRAGGYDRAALARVLAEP